jgi:O-antigen/teichoic acid export membrane protein
VQGQLRTQVVKGAQWAFFSSISVRVLQVITTAVLAKLLMPAQFGIFTLATMVTNAMSIFPETGFAQALVYYQGDIKRAANAAFSLATGTSAVLAGALFSAAPLVGRLFSSPEIIMPTRVMALTLVLTGIASVPNSLLDKELMFKRRAFADLSGWIVYAVLTLTLAFLGFGVWSMVIGWVALSVVTTIVTWIVSPSKPRPEFQLGVGREITDYGKHLVVGVLAAFVFQQIDKAAVGKWLGVTALGFYGMAFTVCSLPATNLTSVVNRVMFPAYSKLQDDIAQIRSVYLRTVKHLASIAFFAAVVMLVLPGPLIRVFYGAKWEPAISLFGILAFYGLARTVGATADSVFMGTGNPMYVQRMRTIQLAVGGLGVYPAARYFGVEGVAVLFTCAYVIGMLYGLAKVQRILGIGTSSWADVARWPAVASILSGAIAWMTVISLGKPSWTGVFVLTVVLSLTYGGLLLLLDRDTYREMRVMLGRPKRVGAL